MTSAKIRNIIKAKAKSLNASYRITKAGEVHFYGIMPNTSKIGWYFAGWVTEYANGEK